MGRMLRFLVVAVALAASARTTVRAADANVLLAGKQFHAE